MAHSTGGDFQMAVATVPLLTLACRWEGKVKGDGEDTFIQQNNASKHKWML